MCRHCLIAPDDVVLSIVPHSGVRNKENSNPSWQVTVPGDDDYQWRVQAYDGDLTSPWSGSRTVKVDATPPDTTIIRGPEDERIVVNGWPSA